MFNRKQRQNFEGTRPPPRDHQALVQNLRKEIDRYKQLNQEVSSQLQEATLRLRDANNRCNHYYSTLIDTNLKLRQYRNAFFKHIKSVRDNVDKKMHNLVNDLHDQIQCGTAPFKQRDIVRDLLDPLEHLETVVEEDENEPASKRNRVSVSAQPVLALNCGLESFIRELSSSRNGSEEIPEGVAASSKSDKLDLNNNDGAAEDSSEEEEEPIRLRIRVKPSRLSRLRISSSDSSDDNDQAASSSSAQIVPMAPLSPLAPLNDKGELSSDSTRSFTGSDNEMFLSCEDVPEPAEKTATNGLTKEQVKRIKLAHVKSDRYNPSRDEMREYLCTKW